jgi:hypothetical protein
VSCSRNPRAKTKCYPFPCSAIPAFPFRGMSPLTGCETRRLTLYDQSMAFLSSRVQLDRCTSRLIDSTGGCLDNCNVRVLAWRGRACTPAAEVNLIRIGICLVGLLTIAAGFARVSASTGKPARMREFQTKSTGFTQPFSLPEVRQAGHQDVAYRGHITFRYDFSEGNEKPWRISLRRESP